MKSASKDLIFNLFILLPLGLTACVMLSKVSFYFIIMQVIFSGSLGSMSSFAVALLAGVSSAAFIITAHEHIQLISMVYSLPCFRRISFSECIYSFSSC